MLSGALPDTSLITGRLPAALTATVLVLPLETRLDTLSRIAAGLAVSPH